MESDGSHILSFSLIIVLLVVLRALFTVCEAAVTEISDGKVKSFETESGRKKILYRLMQKPSALRNAFSAERAVSSVVTAGLAVYAYAAPVSAAAVSLGIGEKLSFFIASAVIMYLSVVVLSSLGDSLPRRLTLDKDCDSLAVRCAVPVRIMSVLTLPVTAIASAFTRLVSYALGMNTADAPDTVTEEEILLMVDAGNETGTIEQSEREMINNVFEFHELTVSEVMTHRVDMVSVSVDADVSEAVYASINSGFSRIPVYDGGIDHIAGIIFVKDLLCLIGTQTAEGMTVRSFMRDAEFVPMSGMCDDVFRHFTAEKIQMAIVVDEYGGTAGVVTMEDLVEAIVGNIQDEYDNEDEDITKISEDTYVISGTADPSEVMKQLGLELPDGSDYDTMSGFITDRIGHMPEDGEDISIEYSNAVFTLLLVEDMRIMKIKAVLKSSENINEKEKSEKYEHEKKD